MESTEQLRADLKSNLKNLKTELGSLASTQDVCKHLRETMWPFIESLVDNIEEIDDSVLELADNAGDILQPDSAAALKGVLVGGIGLVAQMRLRLQPGWTETGATRALMEKMLSEYEPKVTEAMEFVEAVTVLVDDEDEDDEPDADDTQGSNGDDK